MRYSKKLYGTARIDNSDSKEIGESQTIELEYYEIEDDLVLQEESKKYGVEIVKKRVEHEEVKVENKIINNIYSEEKDMSNLLEKLINNKVTPITLEDIIEDLKFSLG